MFTHVYSPNKFLDKFYHPKRQKHSEPTDVDIKDQPLDTNWDALLSEAQTYSF